MAGRGQLLSADPDPSTARRTALQEGESGVKTPQLVIDPEVPVGLQTSTLGRGVGTPPARLWGMLSVLQGLEPRSCRSVAVSFWIFHISEVSIE